MATSTSAISFNKALDAAPRPGARVNLRMWSDTTSFKDVRGRIALVPGIIADNGDVRTDRSGARLNSRFRRNYVSFEESALDRGSELQACVASILGAVAASEYANLVRAKVVDATLWIAVFSSNFAYQGAIAESEIGRASDIGVRILIEDYSRLDGDGVPLKIWLND